MSNLISILQKFSDKLNSDRVSVDKKFETLIAIRALGVTLEVLKESKIGRAVKKCSKLGGKAGLLANEIVLKWTEMIHENEKKSKNDIPKPSNSRKLTENIQVQQTCSDSSSESEIEYANRDQSSAKHSYKKKPKDIHASDSHTSNDSLSENENHLNNKRRNFSNHNSDSDENITKKYQVKNQLHNKTQENSKMHMIKLKRNNIDNSDFSSADIDSDECDKFAENLKSSNKSDKKHDDKIISKVRYDDNSQEHNHGFEQRKLDSYTKYNREQVKYESDDSDFDSDEAHFQRLEESQKKFSKMDNIDFLMPINENKNQKKIIKTEKVRNNMKGELSLKSDKKQMKSEPINNMDNKKIQFDKSLESKPLSNVKINSNSDELKHKSRKPEIKHVASFEAFLKDSALSKPLENHSKKRKSEILPNTESKKPHLQLKKIPTHFAPTELSDLPALNSSLSNSDMDEQSVYNRTDLIPRKKDNNTNNEIKEDIDCTSKYSSERKIWTPKSNLIKNETVEENLRMINGVLETEIAQYNYEKLKAFDSDSKKIQRKTEYFWEKLFKKNHKSANKRDGETWREAYIRNQSAQDYRLKEISERLKKNTEESLNAIPKAKLLTNSNLAKPRRRMTDMRR